MTYLLVALLALSVGWCWGHLTARIVHVPIGATEADDEAALTADEQDRFKAIARYFDQPDDPRKTA
ncbi:hypothetical protein ABT063_24670 [Streptomyces sp. NPDC002838]|uniref:hypothetical protein n=1 Tax=Streptomyces sp. NPDC002838 TaxID=3154436 RepID=UPI0033188305